MAGEAGLEPDPGLRGDLPVVQRPEHAVVQRLLEVLGGCLLVLVGAVERERQLARAAAVGDQRDLVDRVTDRVQVVEDRRTASGRSCPCA